MKNDSYETIADRNRQRAWQVVDELKLRENLGSRRRPGESGRVACDRTATPSTSTSTSTSIPSRPCSRAALPPWPVSRKTPPSGESNASTCCTPDEKCVRMARMVRGPRRRALADRHDPHRSGLGLRRLFRALRPTAAKGADAGNAAGRPAAQIRGTSRPRESLRSGQIYRAVVQGGVRTRAELERWRAEHPLTGISEWMP